MKIDSYNTLCAVMEDNLDEAIKQHGCGTWRSIGSVVDDVIEEMFRKWLFEHINPNDNPEIPGQD